MDSHEEKKIDEMTSAELEEELRGLESEGQLTAQWIKLENINNPDYRPFDREFVRVWSSYCWAVMTDRDTTELAAKWDRLTRRIIKARNGKPYDWLEENARFALREGEPATLTLRQAYEWPIALHEAAHAVVALAVGAEVIEVTRSHRWGPAHVKAGVAHLPAAAQAKIHLAAAEADALAGSYRETSYDSDFASAREAAHSVAATAAAEDTWLDERRRETRRLIVKRAHEVVAVARALIDHVTLTGDEVVQVIKAAA